MRRGPDVRCPHCGVGLTADPANTGMLVITLVCSCGLTRLLASGNLRLPVVVDISTPITEVG